jgi:hypothetical protein
MPVGSRKNDCWNAATDGTTPNIHAPTKYAPIQTNSR